jgi:hypothetical protein
VTGEATRVQLGSVSLTGLPAIPWRFEQLPRRVPNLIELVLVADAPFVVSGGDHLQPGVAGGGPGELADVHARP